MKPGLLLRSAAIFLLLTGLLSADVLVLKNGQKIRGKVVDKGLHYEVTTDGGLRTFLAEEVEDVLTDPKELLGDAESLFEQAKSDYQKALAAAPEEQQNLFREVVAKAGKVREAYVSAVELFPENEALSKKLVQVLQFLRLSRDRVKSEFSRRPDRAGALINPPAKAASPEALRTLTDAALRSDPARRAAGVEYFRSLRADIPGAEDVATAAMVFLGRSDAQWHLGAAGTKVLAEYFAKPWVKDLSALTPALHLEAANWLADHYQAVRTSEPSGAEPILYFAMGHLGHATEGPEREKIGRGLGLVSQNGILGSSEGHAVRDLDDLIDQGDYLAAMHAFAKEYRASPSTAVRFAGAYAQALFAQQAKGSFEPALGTLASIGAPDPALRDHLSALARSFKEAAPCLACAGEGKLRCTNCHGVKEIRFACQRCKGKGRLIPPGLVITKPRQLSKAGSQCPQCKGTGVEKILRCDKCKDGYVDCKRCDKPKPLPEVADLFSATPCARCEGKGLLYKNIVWPCDGCLGLGKKLAPKADPSKVLP